MKEFLLKILKWKLRLLAKAVIWRHKPEVIGVTGNVGKTSTKMAIAAVLSHNSRARASAKSFNNELGLPLAILGDWEEPGGWFFWVKVILGGVFNFLMPTSRYPEVLILEYGVDRPGDMKKLLNIVRPKTGIITAIGDIPVHIEFFAGKEAVVREKSKLTGQLPATGFSILNADDGSVYELKNKTRAHVVTFGFSENADVQITSFEVSFTKNFIGSTFKINYGGSFIPVRLSGVIGKAQAYAAAAAAAAGISFGMNLVDISESLSGYDSPPGRLKVISGMKNTHIIDDTYNASPLATEEALESLKNIGSKRRVAVLGDMMEIGKYTFEAHEHIGELAAKTVDILVTVGIRGKIISDSAEEAKGRKKLKKENIHHFDDVKKASLFIKQEIKESDVILFKGSQSVRMEKAVKEIMAEPLKAKEMLVRQEKRWLENNENKS